MVFGSKLDVDGKFKWSFFEIFLKCYMVKTNIKQTNKKCLEQRFSGNSSLFIYLTIKGTSLLTILNVKYMLYKISLIHNAHNNNTKNIKNIYKTIMYQ